MSSLRFERSMVVQRPIDEVFAFFSDPRNLEAITPPSLRFRIVEMPDGELKVGSKIRYRLSLHGLPLRWTSLISRWEPPFAFVDEQVRGPYRSWVHLHSFEDLNGSTRVNDRVDYSVLGGKLIDRWLVRPDLQRVFDHRAESLERLMSPFGGDADQ